MIAKRTRLQKRVSKIEYSSFVELWWLFGLLASGAVFYQEFGFDAAHLVVLIGAVSYMIGKYVAEPEYRENSGDSNS